MSDFSSLLSQLNKTAKRAVEAKDSEEEKREEIQPKKRHRPSDLPDRRPRDAHELQINLSFLCIGAQKAGTSWLHEMLRHFPELGLPEQKELHFWDWNRRKGLKWYSNQFPRKSDNLLQHYYGEITPCYMALPEDDVEEIKVLFPSARIVFLARDLVDRAWSAITMELRNSARGMEAGKFQDNTCSKMDAATKNRIEKESDPHAQPDSYFMNRLEHPTHRDRSDYAKGLRRWLRHFPKEQLLILDYRQLSENPQEILIQVLTHIGVDDAGVKVRRHIPTEQLEKRVNAGASANKPMRPALRRKMQHHLKPYAKEFNKLLQELDYTWSLDEYE